MLYRLTGFRKCTFFFGSRHFLKLFFSRVFCNVGQLGSSQNERQWRSREGNEKLSQSHIIYPCWIGLMASYQCSGIHKVECQFQKFHVYLGSYGVSWNWDQQFQISHMPLCEAGGFFGNVRRACAKEQGEYVKEEKQAERGGGQ